VLKGVRRLPPTGVVNYAREVGLQQKTQDAITRRDLPGPDTTL
jgi:hypothetical protein